MPFTFLAPALLAAFAALSIPMLMHLRRREREKPMRFPSLMFLQRVTIATARRRRIVDWPLLLLRAAIVALAVLAFARPVIRPQASTIATRGSRRVVLLLDRSMSMAYRSTWPAALDSARAVISALAPGDRVAVIAFDEEAVVEQAFTPDHLAALASLGHIQPGSGATRYGAALRAAHELLVANADQIGGEVIVVSDLQRSGVVGLTGAQLPARATLHVINAASVLRGNSAVIAVTVQRVAGQDSNRARLVVAAELSSQNLATVRRTHATLVVGGRVVASRAVELPPTGNLSIRFDAVPLPASGARVLVALEPDSLAADDTFRVAVPPSVARRVILIAPADAGNESWYLQRALEAGGDPELKVEQRSVGALTGEMLADAAAVILDDVAMPSNPALATWVQNGGGVIQVAAARLAGHDGAPGILPASIGGQIDRTADGGGIVGTAALEQPIFAAARGVAGPPLGVSRFFRYDRTLPTSDAIVLARFDDGMPAVIERTAGRGRALVVLTPLDNLSSDFPLQPAYAPFVRSLTLYAAGNAASPLSRTVGDGWELPSAVRQPVMRTPSGDVARVEVRARSAPFALDASGFYSLFDGRAAGDPVTVTAVNSSAAESDLTSAHPADLLIGVGQDSLSASMGTLVTLVDAERRQQLWRSLLLLVALAAMVEVTMASRGWRGQATVIAVNSHEDAA